MAIWKNIFGSDGETPISIDWLDTPAQVRKNLDIAIHEKTKLSVTLDDGFLTYSSIMVGVVHPSPYQVGRVYIDEVMPRKGNRLFREEGKALTLSYIFKGGGRFRFRAITMGTLTHEGYPAISLTYPGKIEIYEKRDNFRVSPGIIKIIKAEIVGKGEAHILDISGGGIRFRSDFPLEDGSFIDLELFFPEDPKPLRVKLLVLRCYGKAHEEEGKIYHLTRGKFVEMKPPQESRIIRYIMARQREINKKGVP